jgi:hypothetical protein
MKEKNKDRRQSHSVAAALSLAALSLALIAPAGAAAACPNQERLDEQGALAAGLPGCMALEMVSPPAKGGQPAREPFVSAGGERIGFKSVAALGASTGVLSISGDPYVATRGSSAWATAATAQAGIAKGWSSSAEAMSFTPDLSGWLQLGADAFETQIGTMRAYRGALGQPFAALSPPLVPVEEGERKVVEQSIFQGASADHSHLYFVPGPLNSTIRYFPADPRPGGTGADRNTYLARLDAGGPDLELAARDSEGKAWGERCGARLGGISSAGGARNQGAISADGSLTYISTRPGQPAATACDAAANKLRILARTESGGEVEIAELFASECDRVSPACDTADGNDRFQGASADQSKVFFTTTRQLADSDLDTGSECSATLGASAGCDLYLYDADLPEGERLTQVSAGGAGAPSPGEGAGVLNGATAISTDGSHAYFVAQGVLSADPNPAGDEAQAGQPNLYLYEPGSGETAFIGTLEGEDAATGSNQGLWGGAGTFRNQAYPVPAVGDGHVLFLASKAPLTGDDADGARRDLFRYDAAAQTLERVSAAAAGGADNGPLDVASRGAAAVAGTALTEAGRWASEDGETVVFKTAEPLLPADANTVLDSYLWRSGELHLLPGTADTSGKLRDAAVLSHSGEEVAFQSFAQLLPFDGDTAIDVYVARAGGGYPNPVEPEICTPDGGERCQGPASAPLPALALPAAVDTGPVKSPRDCGRAARGAQRLSLIAKRLRRRARRTRAAAPSRRLRRRAARSARQARRLSRGAKRCRAQRKRGANAERRAAR